MAAINNESDGDNREFNIATAGDITIYVNNATYTSENDTATTKYFNTAIRRKKYCLRSNKAVQIISINNTTFTDPITCVANGSITENLDSPRLYKMVIRVLSNDTNVKLRVI